MESKPRFELYISAQIRQIEPYQGGQGLQLNETIQIDAIGFLDICKILSQFHELGISLKNEQGKHYK